MPTQPRGKLGQPHPALFSLIIDRRYSRKVPRIDHKMRLKPKKEVPRWEKVTNARNAEKFTGEHTARAAARKKAPRKTTKPDISPPQAETVSL
jgi:hypothetical protein